jgi:hypothetical protein
MNMALTGHPRLAEDVAARAAVTAAITVMTLNFAVCGKVKVFVLLGMSISDFNCLTLG